MHRNERCHWHITLTLLINTAVAQLRMVVAHFHSYPRAQLLRFLLNPSSARQHATSVALQGADASIASTLLDVRLAVQNANWCEGGSVFRKFTQAPACCASYPAMLAQCKLGNGIGHFGRNAWPSTMEGQPGSACRAASIELVLARLPTSELATNALDE